MTQNKYQDLSGLTFGRLTVLQRADDYVNPTTGKRRIQWLCECNCKEHNKNRVVVHGTNLKRELTRSCGCLRQETTSSVRKKYNNFEIMNDIVKVYLNKDSDWFICDIDDWMKFKNYEWYPHKGYILTHLPQENGEINTAFFHRMVMQAEDDYDVDHKDGNTFNNRKSNLRVCKHQQNMMNQNIRSDNSSGYKGVYFDTERSKWVASLTVHGKRVLYRRFNKIEDAINARKAAEATYFGEYNAINYRHQDCSPKTLEEILQETNQH